MDIEKLFQQYDNAVGQAVAEEEAKLQAAEERKRRFVALVKNTVEPAAVAVQSLVNMRGGQSSFLDNSHTQPPEFVIRIDEFPGASQITMKSPALFRMKPDARYTQIFIEGTVGEPDFGISVSDVTFKFAVDFDVTKQTQLAIEGWLHAVFDTVLQKYQNRDMPRRS